MDIQIPKGMKSPTVVIVGQGTMTGDDKMNKMHEKRMDMLERKLDQQYKTVTDGKSITKEIEALQSSFMKKLNRFMDSNKTQISQQNNKLAEALKRVVENKVKVIKSEDAPKSEIKSFISKIDSLEDAIRGITLKARNNTSPNNGRLNKSFESFFARMEKLIKEVKPRLTPSPS